MIANQLYILGDSISCGVMYNAQAARYTLFRGTFDRVLRAQGVTVKNYAKPGCTSAMGLDVAAKSEPLPGGIALIEFGGNDSDLKWAEVSNRPDDPHSALVPIPEFENAMRSLIRQARSRLMTPVVSLPLPVVPDRYFNWISKGLIRESILRYLGSVEHIYRWQERYAFSAQRVAYQEHCSIFDMRGLFLNQRSYGDLMSNDGIHPNAAGYALIRDAFLASWNDAGF